MFFSVSCDVLVFSENSSQFILRGEIFTILESGRVECSKKALFCGDFCDRNQAIILVVLVLFSL